MPGITFEEEPMEIYEFGDKYEFVMSVGPGGKIIFGFLSTEAEGEKKGIGVSIEHPHPGLVAWALLRVFVEDREKRAGSKGGEDGA